MRQDNAYVLRYISLESIIAVIVFSFDKVSSSTKNNRFSGNIFIYGVA